MAAGIIDVNDFNFKAKVLDSEQPVLVDFWAPWCRPCLLVAPALEALAAAHGKQMRFAKLNVDNSTQVPFQYHIQSIPTLLLFENGRLVDKIIGAVPKERIEKAIAKILSVAA